MPKGYDMGYQSGVDPGSAAFRRGAYGGSKGGKGMGGEGGKDRGNQSFVDAKAAPPDIKSGRNGPGAVSKGSPKYATHPKPSGMRSYGGGEMKSYKSGSKESSGGGSSGY